MSRVLKQNVYSRFNVLQGRYETNIYESNVNVCLAISSGAHRRGGHHDTHPGPFLGDTWVTIAN